MKFVKHTQCWREGGETASEWSANCRRNEGRGSRSDCMLGQLGHAPAESGEMNWDEAQAQEYVTRVL